MGATPFSIYLTVCLWAILFIFVNLILARRNRQVPYCANSLNFCPLVLDDNEPGYDFIRISVPDIKLKLQPPYPQRRQVGHNDDGIGPAAVGTLECSEWVCNYLIDNGPVYSDYLKFLKSPQTLFLLGARIGNSLTFTVRQCPANLTQSVQVSGVQLSAGSALAGNEAMNDTMKEKLVEENYKLLNLLLVREYQRQQY